MKLDSIDLRKAFSEKPPELDFVWSGFLAGTVGALVAPGATGKSFWALEAAMAVACNVSEGDLLQLNPKHHGRVVYLAGEDPHAALKNRLHAIGQYLSPTAREDIAENLSLVPTVGSRLDVMADNQLKSIIELCSGSRLVVLDTLSRIHQLDENSNSDMAQLVSQLEHIAVKTGATILFLHHVNKGSAREGQTDQQQAARGASALIDNARWCGFVAKMTDHEAESLSDRVDGSAIGADQRGYFLRFGISKQNYGIQLPDMWFKKHDGGVLIPTSLRKSRKTGKGMQREVA